MSESCIQRTQFLRDLAIRSTLFLESGVWGLERLLINSSLFNLCLKDVSNSSRCLELCFFLKFVDDVLPNKADGDGGSRVGMSWKALNKR